jgi:acetyl esterase/lipase
MSRNGRIGFALATGLVFIAAAASAQMPAELVGPNRAIGRRIDTPGVRAIYTPLQALEPWPGVQVARDVKYGPGALDTLDVMTSGQGRGKPVLIYVHGGGYVGGDKAEIVDGKRIPFYDNIMVWAVRHGMVGVNMNYELAPKAQYPVVQQDIAKVVAWTQKEIAKSGGDPKRIFLTGFSAGGGNVAAYLSHPELYPAGGVGLKGAILVSLIGGYELTGDRPHPYFGEPSAFAARSAKAGLLKSDLPLLITSAEFDPETVIAENQAMAKALSEAGKPVTFTPLKDHNHLSQMTSMNTADESLGAPVEAFVKGLR